MSIITQIFKLGRNITRVGLITNNVRFLFKNGPISYVFRRVKQRLTFRSMVAVQNLFRGIFK